MNVVFSRHELSKMKKKCVRRLEADMWGGGSWNTAAVHPPIFLFDFFFSCTC